ncbi:hypothetical protein EXIGLDRAFT_833605 [Exidia glandulosa HHB12029]|uniref:G-protein coupled receptors family 1 profile domain-containing protein n=1 Tax=Exidia glandulosa HHB12029 TaxID=1314781 RepID=A0A165KL22_EXIGL|nr:hypothetical protein EXIGLDRAFT_833605 [Exidia glandulosa HHB12029]
MEFVWSRKFNWATLAYLFMKVVTPAMLVGGLGAMSLVDVSNQRCVAIALFNAAASAIVTICGDVLLTLRVHYMYNCNRRLFVFNICFYTAITIVNTTLGLVLLPGLHDFENGPALMGPCYTRLIMNVFVQWLLELVYHLYLSALALVKVSEAYRHFRRLGSRKSVFALLVQGNLEYFLIVLGGYSATAIFTLDKGPAMEHYKLGLDP